MAKYPTLNKTPFGGAPATGRKPSDSALLPSKHALALLTKGNPAQRSFADFGKASPVGSGAPNPYDKIIKSGDF